MQTTKHPTEWTPQDFIQHSANLDHYERKLSGMAKLGEETTNAPMYRAIDEIVKIHRTHRQQYFTHHQIVPVL